MGEIQQNCTECCVMLTDELSSLESEMNGERTPKKRKRSRKIGLRAQASVRDSLWRRDLSTQSRREVAKAQHR